MGGANGALAEPRPRRLWPALLGYAVAAVCLVWVLRDVRPGELIGRLRDMRWGWLAAAVAFDILGYVCQGWRWALLLRPTGRLSVPRATQAIYAGLFTSEVLPLRAGEGLRAFVVSRWLGVNTGAVLPSIFVERLMDGLWLALAVGVTAVFVPLPPSLGGAAEILGLIVVAAVATFLAVAWRRPAADAADSRSPSAIARGARAAADGGRRIWRSPGMWMAFSISALMLTAQVLAFWLAMRAYGLGLGMWAGAAVLLVVRLGTAIPNAPANVGTFQFATVAGLSLFNVGKDLAAGFSLVVFVILTVPLWAIGSIALAGVPARRPERAPLRVCGVAGTHSL